MQLPSFTISFPSTSLQQAQSQGNLSRSSSNPFSSSGTTPMCPPPLTLASTMTLGVLPGQSRDSAGAGGTLSKEQEGGGEQVNEAEEEEEEAQVKHVRELVRRKRRRARARLSGPAWEAVVKGATEWNSGILRERFIRGPWYWDPHSRSSQVHQPSLPRIGEFSGCPHKTALPAVEPLPHAQHDSARSARHLPPPADTRPAVHRSHCVYGRAGRSECGHTLSHIFACSFCFWGYVASPLSLF